MYCSHCGKKVGDTMLFCPFCGEPIVVPDQDDDPVAAVEPSFARPEPDAPKDMPDAAFHEPEAEAIPMPHGEESPEAESTGNESDAARELLDWNRDRRSFSGGSTRETDVPVEPFSPLSLDQDEAQPDDWREEIIRRKEAAAPEKRPPEFHRREEETARLEGRAPKLEEGGAGAVKTAQTHRAANTFVPPKAMDPEDIFMDGSKEDYDGKDEYDAYDDYDDVASDDDGYAYEDETEGSFFMRHIRGIVGLTLFVILILMFVFYAFTNAGQRSLARMNLAWNTGVYASLGYEYYQDGLYAQAGLYYERALGREPQNYRYASSAAMAYVTGGDTEKAAAMLKKCVEIDPTKLEPYIYLLNLYPEAAQRPWDVTQLIQKGYETTGDERLAITG